MQTSAFGPEVAKRFRISNAPTVVAKLSISSPVTFVRVCTQTGSNGWTDSVPPEDAYVLQVMLKALKDPELSFKNAPLDVVGAETASIFLLDMEHCPVAKFSSPFDSVRFYVSRDALKQIAEDDGWHHSGDLAIPPWGSLDFVAHHLVSSLIPTLEQTAKTNSLLVDHVAIALAGHLMSNCSEGAVPRVARGGLSQWQLRHVKELIDAHLADGISLAELAGECDLSVSYFTRAFRKSLGRAPHQWLLERRIDLAKSMIIKNRCSLSDIACASGFSDQSHMTKIFSKSLGITPGIWKKERCKMMERNINPKK